MADPYTVLNLPEDASDETIRGRYLDLVRQYSPERHPEKFSAIRAAYESLRDLDTRIRYRLFEAGHDDTLDSILEEIACPSSRRRFSLNRMLQALPPR